MSKRPATFRMDDDDIRGIDQASSILDRTKSDIMQDAVREYAAKRYMEAVESLERVKDGSLAAADPRDQHVLVVMYETRVKAWETLAQSYFRAVEEWQKEVSE